MLPFSHFFSGYVVGVILVWLGIIEISVTSLAFLGLFSLLPDIDVMWFRELQKHHSSIFHTPVFWAAVTFIVGIFEPNLALTVLILSFVHILTDGFTGRSGGVFLLYPFNDREFRICTTINDTGSLDPVKPNIDILKEHMSYYLEDKRLVLFEISVNIVGIISLFYLLTNL